MDLLLGPQPLHRAELRLAGCRRAGRDAPSAVSARRPARRLL